MNREQRRKLGWTLEQAKNYEVLQNVLRNINEADEALNNSQIKDGDKVKLNTFRIKQSPDFSRLNKSYQAFVNNNKDTIFTTKLKTMQIGNKYRSLWELEGQPWVFWEGNLIKVNEFIENVEEKEREE